MLIYKIYVNAYEQVQIKNRTNPGFMYDTGGEQFQHSYLLPDISLPEFEPYVHSLRSPCRREPSALT